MLSKERISLEEAQRLLLEAVEPLGSEKVRLEEGLGRVLSEEVRVPRDYPPFPRAAMDGYAVWSGDLSRLPPGGTLLRVTGLVGPAASGKVTVGRGEATRILTGGSLPEGADAVVPEEMVEIAPGGVRVHLTLKPGEHVVPQGSEAKKGEHLMASGLVLGALELAILADLGYPKIRVRRRPRVAVLATGDELVAATEPGSSPTVYPSNVQLLLNLIRAAGGQAVSLEVVQDRSDLLGAALRRVLEAGVVVTTGGTGKGDRDLMAAAVAELGGEFLFQGVAMKPGKQTLCARAGHALIFALPGRPPAAHVSFLQLVRPALLISLGLPRVFLPEVTGRLARPLRIRADIPSFIHCRLYLGGDSPEVSPVGSEGVGLLARMLAANGLMVIPPGRERFEAGERVRVQVLNLDLEALRHFVSPGEDLEPLLR